MTAVTNTFTRFDSVGVREDLSDDIYNIAPSDTPFMQNAGRGKAAQTFFEWQTDTLAANVSTNQQVEGNDITSFTQVVPTVRLGNYCEIPQKNLIISGTLEATDRAGRDSEVGYQVAKLGKEIKRDMETSFLANKGAVAGTTSVARQTGSLLAFIKTNHDKSAVGSPVAPVYTTIPTDVWTNGTQRAFTETILKNVIQQCWTQGASPKSIMLGGTQKQAFSGFAGVVELTATQSRSGQATIMGAADTYVSDFGTLSVIPNRFMRTRDAFVMDWDYVELKYLRPFHVVDLAKTGDATKKLLQAEVGLKVGNEKALGVCVDLT